jgi:hypothetical protein
MSRFFNLCFGLLVMILIFNTMTIPTQARPEYVGEIPNGSIFSCANCHDPDQSVTRFGTDFLASHLLWSEQLALLDSDLDGYANGIELQDPDGTWIKGQPDPGDPSLVTNPSDRYSYPGAPTATPTVTPTELPTEIPTATPEATSTPSCIHSGDVNLSGSITAGDAQTAFLIALQIYSPTEQQRCAADCNGNGSVTAGDAQQIFMAALGIGSCADPID